ncbi:hypothetical protein [Berryella intestinalis]|uniref:hypothetical protein n=1 Tax=Berryella intestinalis TaxID=1531429 RepID=UPI00130D82E9|nr:hypothetical protein [Berryella intestinalis]
MALKRLGFSVGEVRRMSWRDYVVYGDVLAESLGSEGAGDEPKRATQADIDRLMG